MSFWKRKKKYIYIYIRNRIELFRIKFNDFFSKILPISFILPYSMMYGNLDLSLNEESNTQ